MINPSISEVFTADAGTVSALYPGGGTSPEVEGRTTLTIAYDATNGSYTITAPQASQVFRAADRDTASSDRRITRYVRTQGTVTDSLVLTKAGESGILTNRYVGGGIQRRTDTAGGIQNNRLNVFTYGVQTANGAVPITGTGTFAFGIIGMEAGDDVLADFDGRGTMQVNFASATLTGVGLKITRRFNDNGYAALDQSVFTLEGVLGVGGNALSGSIRFSDAAATLEGRFYGSAAEEVGATFYGANTRNQMISGVLLGRSRSTPGYETLTDLVMPIELQAYTAAIFATRNAGTNDYGDTSLGSGGQTSFLVATDPRSYKYFYDLNDGNRVAAQSDSRFTTYVPASGQMYRIYNPGPGNDELALTYTGFGLREMRVAGARAMNETFVFGLETGFSQLPLSGQASYRGVVYGSAIGAGSNADLFALHGSAAFDFDFGRNAFTGSMQPAATNTRTQVTTDLGTLTFINPWMPGAAMMTSAFAADIGGPSGTTGRITGRFYGPQGQEVGGSFSLVTPAAGTVLTGVGVVAAVRR
ncbi:transferrin-binding protein-like solute binding protein [Novosphingobium sp. AP12]|uniref:transferrin-binding protein-like solute binding protein n=1 Tax=Novosphingobium sp. AP12 TaxID=1144305 RepID=UPI00027214A2|nr:transferrin-binding protein-like solute binding protein [Novosphingobium sp. AP12]EJL32311.1 Transferrin binding protein-like solute binding protein [Novosphingobium sp. AP12]